MSKAGRVTLYIVAAVLALGCAALVVYYAVGDKIRDSIDKRYYIEYAGHKYLPDGSGNIVKLPENKQEVFTAHGAETITVRLTVNADFEFVVGDAVYKFSDEIDSRAITERVRVSGNKIVLDNTNSGLNVKSVLGEIWGEIAIAYPPSLPDYPYRLVVTSESGETVEIAIGAGDNTGGGDTGEIYLSKDYIVL